jgi:capsid protein
MLEAWKFYKNRRNFAATGFCQPVFEAWMEEAVAIGRVDAPGFFADPLMRRAYLKSEWVGDAPGSIDPEKEANAAEKLIDIGLSNLTDQTMAITGKQWNDVHRVRAREHKKRVEDGLEAPIVGPQTMTSVNDAEQPAKPKPGQNPADNGGSDLEKPEEA